MAANISAGAKTRKGGGVVPKDSNDRISRLATKMITALRPRALRLSESLRKSGAPPLRLQGIVGMRSRARVEAGVYRGTDRRRADGLAADS